MLHDSAGGKDAGVVGKGESHNMSSIRPARVFAVIARLNPLARVAAGVSVTFTLGLFALLVNGLLLVCDPLLISMPLLILSLLALLLLLGLSIASFFKGTLRASLPWPLGAALLVLAVLPAIRLSWSLERLTWARVARRGATIVAAIDAYQRDHHEPPASLAALVPRYLASVPSTGAPAYPGFEFERYERAGDRTLVWYDLGSRHGQPIEGLWVYPDGPGDHAILALTFADEGGLEEARIDRAPKLTPQPFDLTRWKSDRSARLAMGKNLPGELKQRGMKPAQIAAALGDPDGTRQIPSSPWELRVACAHGLMNWDVFFFWPSRRYPKKAHGGSIERIGDWAYVHE
jgi:hypothetical protein